MLDDNLPQLGQKRPYEDSALKLPARKKAGPPNYWKDKGRHVGRTIHPFLNIGQLILAGLQHDRDLALAPANAIEKYPAEVRLQYKIYNEVLHEIPCLEEGLMNKTIQDDELKIIATHIQAGVNAARAEDIKGLKPAVILWITDPEKGLVPPIGPGDMASRGWNHEATGKELCPAGLDWNDPLIKSQLKSGEMTVSSDQWPICFYLNGEYDLEHPWTGLLRGRLIMNMGYPPSDSKGSVDGNGRATKASNSMNHGMTSVTPASIVYIGTLVRFALDSRKTMSLNDTVADIQPFFNMLLAFLHHPHERENLNDLLAWWNEQIFPHLVITRRAPTINSALSRCVAVREKRVGSQAASASSSG